jgi:hypothetical protein
MSAIELEAARLLHRHGLNVSAVSILAISAAIAALAPFDVAFAAATYGSPLARVLLILALGSIGLYFCRLNGFSLRMPGLGPVKAGALCAFAVAIYVVIIDAWLFRSVLPPVYVDFFHTHDLGQRLTYYMCRAYNENVLYRLFGFSALAFGLIRVTHNQTLSIIISSVAVQAVNVCLNAAPMAGYGPVTLPFVVYFMARGVVPGIVWAIVFWRQGFLAAEIGSVGCHAFLQPMLGALL